MNILHVHYRPPQAPDKTGGILFWMETSDVALPKRGHAAKKEKSRLHPFCAEAETIKRLLNIEGASKTATLRLPAVKGIPLPSPQLIHNWEGSVCKSGARRSGCRQKIEAEGNPKGEADPAQSRRAAQTAGRLRRSV